MIPNLKEESEDKNRSGEALHNLKKMVKPSGSSSNKAKVNTVKELKKHHLV